MPTSTSAGSASGRRCRPTPPAPTCSPTCRSRGRTSPAATTPPPSTSSAPASAPPSPTWLSPTMAAAPCGWPVPAVWCWPTCSSSTTSISPDGVSPSSPPSAAPWPASAPSATSPSSARARRPKATCTWRSPSGLVAGLDALRRLEAQRAGGRLVVDAGLGLDDEGDMVAHVEPADDGPGDPALHPVEDGDAARPGPPRAALELVDLVAGLAAEQLGQAAVVVGQPVDGEHRRRRRHREGVVRLRHAGQDPGRVDAALRPEADEAARAAPVRRDGGDDDHGGVEAGGQPAQLRLAIRCRQVRFHDRADTPDKMVRCPT